MRKRMTIKNCIQCNKEFLGEKLTSKFCSSACMGLNARKNSYAGYLINGGVGFKNSYSPKSFKAFFMEEQGGVCAICKMKPFWNDKELVFIMDHIDGNSSNNKRENMRMICPNCDTQLPTFKNRNKGSGRYFRRQRIKEGKSY